MENSTALRQLLNCCSNPDCEWYDDAWAQFVKRYDRQIRTLVLQRLTGNVHRDMGQICNLLVSNVYDRLRDKLHLFDAESRLEKFDSWLTTFSNRVVGNYLRPQKNRVFLKDTSEQLNYVAVESPDYTDTDMIDYFRYHLRRILKGTASVRLERDLNLAYLVIFEQLDYDTCWAHPCMRSGMTKRSNPEANAEKERARKRHYMEVFMNRIRKRLREDQQFLSELS